MTYRLSKKAAHDIEDVYLYGAQSFGIEQAEKYHMNLTKSLDFLAENPFAVRERTEFDPPVRIHNFGSHVVIYTIDSQGVFIIRVLGGRQDWQQLLE